MIFRCKNCGGNVVYSPERKKMFCPFCESEDSEEREDGVIETSGEENGTAEGTVHCGRNGPGSGSRTAGQQNGSSRGCCAEKGDKGMSQLWWRDSHDGKHLRYTVSLLRQLCDRG